MKKTLITTFLSVMAMVSSAITKITKESTDEQCRAVLAELCAITNRPKFIIQAAKNAGVYRLVDYKNLNHLCAEFDETLSSRGLGICPFYTKSFPKTSAIARRTYDMDAKFPTMLSLGTKYNTEASFGYLAKYCTADEYISVLQEILQESNTCYFVVDYIRNAKITFQKKYGLTLIKKMLYRQGKSFVTKDGVNPCEGMMNELTASLNAARLNGFNEWLIKVGCKNHIDFSFLPTAEEIQVLKERILMGEIQITILKQKQLYIGLSTDDYNAFVKKYNGDSK